MFFVLSLLLITNVFCLCGNYRKNIKKRKANNEQKILTCVVFLGMNELIFLVFLTFMLRFKLFDFQYKYVIINLHHYVTIRVY